MAQVIRVDGIRIFAKAATCAHSCRYCLVGKKSFSPVDFSRFYRLVERFVEARVVCHGRRLKLLAGFEDSYELSVEVLRGLFVLQKKVGWGETEANGIKLGGLKKRSNEEMRAWLLERQEHAGLKTVHGSLAGCGSVHDRWNGRKGDFEFLFHTMSIAAELGLRIHQRIFVVQSTLPVLGKLIERLDEIPGQALRYLSLFVFQGLATRLEDDRITEMERDRLPSRVSDISKRPGDRWLSEREWIADYRDVVQSDSPKSLFLPLEVTEENIARLEEMSCEDIVADLTCAEEDVYGALPSRLDLCRRFADGTNKKIYASADELERKWLAGYFAEHSLVPPRSLAM